MIYLKKSYLLFIIILLFTLVGCNGDEESSKVESSEVKEVYYGNPFEAIDDGLGYIELDKEIYDNTDTIKVNVFNAKSSDYVAIYDLTSEPDNGVPYKKIKVSNNTTLEFDISSMGLEANDYVACLYANKTWYLYDRVEFQVDDNDATDYKVNGAKIERLEVDGKITTALTIFPSSAKELTYTAYWAKDGKRLSDYTDLARVVKGNSMNDIVITFNENLFMPNEANQIEIAVTEGKSTSFYLNVKDSFKLKQSVYKYNFQVLTDIHANPDYGFWSSHFYNALLDIKCLSGNTSGIFTCGDNTDMGSTSHYQHFNSIVDSVFNKNAPNIYYTVGNHDYMYYKEDVGGFDAAISYFTKTTKMPNHYYSVEVEGHKCIFLSSDVQNVQGTMEEKQLNWFKNELASLNKDEFAFVFVHQPFSNTTSGTLEGQDWAGLHNVSEEIKNVLKDYPNVVVFTGHTHYSLESRKTTNFGYGSNANYVNNASIAYLVDDKYDYTVGGQCNFVEVYEDYILIKGRDLYEGKWVSNAMFVCYLY